MTEKQHINNFVIPFIAHIGPSTSFPFLSFPFLSNSNDADKWQTLVSVMGERFSWVSLSIHSRGGQADQNLRGVCAVVCKWNPHVSCIETKGIRNDWNILVWTLSLHERIGHDQQQSVSNASNRGASVNYDPIWWLAHMFKGTGVVRCSAIDVQRIRLHLSQRHHRAKRIG